MEKVCKALRKAQKRIRLGFSLGLLVLLVFIIFYPSVSIVHQDKPIRVLIAPGSHLDQIAETVYEATSLPHPELFLLYVEAYGLQTKLRAGEYDLPPGSSLKDIVNGFVYGRVVKHAFTLVDGWTFEQIRSKLDQQPGLVHDLSGNKQQAARQLQVNASSPEGTLRPDTYFYQYPMTESQLLIEAHTAMQALIQEAWPQRESNLPYKTSYQALIAASIVEKETNNAEDQRYVASVIVNRLQKHMRLQMDPTAIYGAHINPRLFKAGDLKIDSAYNTYLHRGLPPTPIAMPSASAVEAVLHPAHTSYLYFVSKGDGTHVFSNTLSEQKKAINDYLIKASNKDD